MTQNIYNTQLTGAEKAIYKGTYDFAIRYENLSPTEATQKAEQKIIQKRGMASKIKSKH